MKCPYLEASVRKTAAGHIDKGLITCPDAEACQTGYPCEVVLGLSESRKMTDAQVPPIPTQDPVDKVRQAVEDWWIDTTAKEMGIAVPKAVEYGSTDLAELGRTMGLILNREGMDHAEATELGIFFYLEGKFARWIDAIKNRRSVSDDTIMDIAIYIKMAQRVRAVGGWPFNPEDK